MGLNKNQARAVLSSVIVKMEDSRRLQLHLSKQLDEIGLKIERAERHLIFYPDYPTDELKLLQAEFRRVHARKSRADATWNLAWRKYHALNNFIE